MAVMFDDFAVEMPEAEIEDVEPPASVSVILQATDLLRALRLVEHATSKDFERPILCFVVLRAGGGALWAIAADNYRIAEARIPVPESVPEAWSDVLINDDDRKVLRAFLTRKTREAVVTVTERDVTVVCGRAVVTVGRQQGVFPDIAQVRSALSENPSRVSFNGKFLEDAGKAGAAASSALVVHVDVGGPLQPVLFSTDDDDFAYREIVMPVRTAS